MNNEQNEKLCKLLGITPVYHLYINFGDFDNDYRIVIDKRKYKLIADYRSWVDDDDELRGLKNDLYPNLSAPGNFVKLQQIYFDCVRVIALNYSDFGSDIVSGFITKFCNFVLYAGDVVPKEVEQFKQQAQQTDWEY